MKGLEIPAQLQVFFVLLVFGPEIPALLQVFMLANSWLLGVRGLTSDIGSAMGSLQQIVYDMQKEANFKVLAC
ncbi:hypothetical protein HQN90_33925 [Paenibacillus alba]|uniref:hypothetical protein n=1 Tax=Paenibacillus alba TaxID=1197127 RepID=UPI001564BCA0|nr:hypothetical protein [Paenibacillus alba]NQX71132.1 hypothetical protein [Paenibacillus alba]